MQRKTAFFRKISRAAPAVIVIMAAALTSACSQEKQSKDSAALPNEFGKAAAQMQVKTCAALFSVLGQTLTVNSQYSAKLIPDKTDSNAHGLTAIVGQIYGKDGAETKGMGTLFAAPVNGRCEGLLVRTLLMRQACAEVAAARLPQGTKRQDDLAQTAVFAMPDGGTITMLPASADSCIVTMTMNLQDKQR